MKVSITRTSILAISLAVLTACGGDAAEGTEEAAAVAEVPAAIADRQANFEAIGDSFKAIRGQLEGDSPDLAIIEASATDINERAQLIGDYFPAGTSVDDGFDTEALASIWEDPEGFETAHQNLATASAALAEAAASGDAAAVGEAVKNMGGTCKACHDDFRLDTD